MFWFRRSKQDTRQTNLKIFSLIQNLYGKPLFTQIKKRPYGISDLFISR
jgi:hypothetical protein